jgi:molybdate transport system ATP-binding protein
MDEPLAALDVQRKREILPYLDRLHDELDIPVIYVSHAPGELARLADHVVLLDAGRSPASGSLRDMLARTDLPLLREDDAGVVLDATIAEVDAEWHLARAEVAGASLWVRDTGALPGRRVRLRVLARDVSLALQRHDGVSILNLLPATVRDLAADDHPAARLVRLDLAGTPLLARVTARSAAALGLVPGKAVWVQIKSVAVLE